MQTGSERNTLFFNNERKDTKVKTGSSLTLKYLIGQEGDARSCSAQDFLSVKFFFFCSYIINESWFQRIGSFS